VCCYVSGRSLGDCLGCCDVWIDVQDRNQTLSIWGKIIGGTLGFALGGPLGVRWSQKIGQLIKVYSAI